MTIVDRRQLVAGAGALAGLAVMPRTAFAASPRIEALIARMTIAEKAGQLSCFADTIRPFAPSINPLVGNQDADETLREVRAGRVGTLFNGIGVAGARRSQRIAIEESRLGIPLMFAADVIHGLKTVFPIPLAEAGAFDPALAETTARAAAVEATAVGLHWTFAPMVDVARDQRWGRVCEGSGEDPYLGAVIGAARVRGFQGKALTDADALLACPKHFVGYGAVSGGMEYNFTEMSPGTLREVHLAPFTAAFDAGALTTMAAFNDVNGVPASGDQGLLTGVLRDEWGFAGLVISDYTSEQELVAHGYAADDADATRLAILAGVDISMQSGLYNAHLPALVASGAVAMAVVDAAVRRVLHVKEAIGLFDDPYRSLDLQAERDALQTPAMTALARDAGARSIVLLKNDGDLLPIAPTARIALIGPCADDDVLGAWSFYGDPRRNVSIEAGVRAALDPAAALSVVRGADIETAIPGGIAAAVAAARAADIVLLAIGESSAMSGEAQSRTDIAIPPPQQALAEAVAATGTPVVVLLRHGRALALEGAVADAPAILATWFLGSEMGHAVADVVFGKVNPSARLAVSFPNESGQQPYFYNHRTTGRPAPVTTGVQEYKARYRETRNVARWPFGFGLSYTGFALSDLAVPATLARDGTLAVSVRVTNTGRRGGSHVVQLYIRDRVASRTRPVRELKRFARVTLDPGASATVRFSLTRADLLFWGADGWTVEPGAFDLWIADHAEDDGLHAVFTLAG